MLASLPEIESRSLAERLIASGAVLVDGEARAKSHRVDGGEELEVTLPDETELVPADVGLTVTYEDEHLLVVDKPAGLVTHPSGPEQRVSVVHGVVALGATGGDVERPGIVHRLDRDTSGLLLVARSEEAYRRLSDAIRERRVERRYRALVSGAPRSRTGRITAPIGRDRRDRTRRSLDSETPREAITWFELLETIGLRSLLEVRLETGRTHQIRVHLEAIELPVCGDPVYGVPGDLGLERQFLHAHRLRFEHPFTGKELDLRSPLPEDLEAALARAKQ